MEIIPILIAGLIALLGYPIGMFIARMTKEELKPGRKYFVWISNIMIILSSAFALYFLNINFIIAIVSAIIITIAVSLLNPKPLIGYPILIVDFMIASSGNSLLLIISTFIFIYGLSSAALRR